MLDVLEAFRIRFAVRPLLLFLAVLALLAIAHRTRLLRLPPARSSAIAARIVMIASVVGLLGYVASALWYASEPHFFDNAEPTMISVGWLFHAGQPVYHAVDAAERYALIYGPLAYVFHGAALALMGPSIAVSKALGAAAGLVSLPLTYLAVRRQERAAHAAIITGAYALLLLLFRHYSFWTRPEPFQLLAVAASLYFAARGTGVPAAVAVGIASGVLWNLKFTGPLYSLPILALLHVRAGRRATLVAMAAAALVAAAPFVIFSNVSLTDYITWVRLSARTGLLLSTLRQNLEWAAFLLLPILISSYGSIGGTSDRDAHGRIVAVALVAGAIAIVVAAAKPGAGPYHLMPFLPAIAYVVAGNTSRLATASAIDPAVSRAAVAFGIVASIVAIAQQAQLASTMAVRRPLHEIADIEAFAGAHPGVVEVGYGSTEAASLARPVLTFRNNVYLLDQPAIREHQLAGVELPRATIDALEACRVNYWLIPKGEAPFSGVNGYAAVLLRPLYSDEFRRTFLSTHSRIGETSYYDVWQCEPRIRK